VDHEGEVLESYVTKKRDKSYRVMISVSSTFIKLNNCLISTTLGSEAK
jgi:hypothetical protein